MNDRTIPAFEGRPVDSTVIKVVGSASLDELEGVVLGMDDAVQMLTIYRVTGVDHVVDEKTGNLVRVQKLKAVEAALKPIDPSDPSDDGILRAIPYTVGTVVANDEDA